MKAKIGILGATGFTGYELILLLLRHPYAEITWLSSESQSGQKYSQLYPRLAGQLSSDLENLQTWENVKASSPDIVFSCLPHSASAKFLAPFIQNGIKVIDLSADFRIQNLATYEKAYGTHASPELLAKSQYGLCEVYGEAISKTKIVANPGCYPTSILLPLIPLLREGIVSAKNLILDSKSGVSGAGKKATEGTHYIYCNESFSAYKVGDQHRHLPEIEEQLSLAAGESVKALFTPHLVPMERGIFSTIYADLKPGHTQATTQQCLQEFYQNSLFVKIRNDNPRTADVRHTNFCHIQAYQPQGTQKLILLSVIDNMVKGASGQAVQNMNLLLGFAPELGLF